MCAQVAVFTFARLGIFCRGDKRSEDNKKKKAGGSRKGCLIGYQILSVVETEVSMKGKLGEI